MTTRTDEARSSRTRGEFVAGRPGYRPVGSLTDARVNVINGFAGLSSPTEIASRLDYVFSDLTYQINRELEEVRLKPSYISPKSVTVEEIAAGAITVTEIADDSISTPKLQAGAVTAAKIAAATITANEIATGTITANEIAAKAITATKLFVPAPGSALNHDPGMQDSSSWEATFGVLPTFTTVSDGKVGNSVARNVSGSLSAITGVERIPADADKTYRVRCWARKVSGSTGTFSLGVRYFDSTGALISSDFPILTVTPGAPWTEYTGSVGAGTSFTFPATTRTFSVTVVLNGGSGDSVYEAQDVRLEEMSPGTLIKDGVITTAKIAAGAVTATEISVSTLSAIAADMGTITAGKIDVGSIEINAGTEQILFGSATAPLTGTGIFLGKDGSDYEFRVGNPAGDYIHWNGSAFTVSGDIIATGNIQDNAVTFGKIDTTGTDAVNEQVLRYDTSGGKVVASSRVTISSSGAITTLDINASAPTLQLTSSGTNFATVKFNVKAGADRYFEIAAQDTTIADRIWIREIVGATTYKHWEAKQTTILYGDETNIPIHSFSGDVRISGLVAITDGVTAPATVSGIAQIYVDTADGDLKVKFGDGTVKTIVVDT